MRRYIRSKFRILKWKGLLNVKDDNVIFFISGRVSGTVV